MKFTPLRLAGASLISLERREDERGHFARTWCARTFAEQGIEPCLAQCSVSFNRRRGTLRGMHYQAAPHEEAKWVRVTRGAIYDVAVDLRPSSPTYGEWIAVELSAETGRSLYLPAGFAHGFQTLADETEVYYMMSCEYSPQHVRGFRWDDPSVGIRWPEAPSVVSPRDRSLPRAPWAAGLAAPCESRSHG
jgi:dTDP-4-dehydrorhamnose 3,5-epimerase